MSFKANEQFCKYTGCGEDTYRVLIRFWSHAWLGDDVMYKVRRQSVCKCHYKHALPLLHYYKNMVRTIAENADGIRFRIMLVNAPIHSKR